MNKKKLAILSLSIAMMMTAFTGLTACNPDEPEPEPEPEPNTPVTITKEDTRTNAYTAYSVSGTKLGDYKTIAAAINAAVEEDADTGDIGSYVTKTGGTTKLFVNRAGYSSAMDDTFWYYTDGNKLEGMFDWETDSISYLQNNKVITHEVSGWGTKSVQSWNGYGLLDENGKLLDTAKQTAQSWELSSTMDAAVIQLSSRLRGVSGLNYEIDLSNVKITPPYDGADDTYAFLGFYSWQDYYVIATGIACNSRTGDWYAFEATSRDDSFSDAEYNIGKKLMSSTWNEQGGYFKPDCSSLSMSIRTTVQEDDEGEYQVNQLRITFSDGTEYARDIDASTVNEFFSGANIGYENAYVFVAGLDIVNEIVSGVHTENTDYFNGSTFENLTVTAATAHVADETELPTTKYGYVKLVDAGDYDILLASTATKQTRGIVYDYTILNTYACTSYAASNGKDVYSFRYDGDPVVDDDYGPTASVYQQAIDALAAVTADNALSYEDAITAVGAWYGSDSAGTGSTISARSRNVLDFSKYLAAKEILASSVQISDEGLAVAKELNALGNILNYTCKGWTTDAEDTVGYLYSEVVKFRAIKAEYDKLSADDQAAVFYRYEKEAFETWQKLSEDLQTVMASSAFTNEANVFHSYTLPYSFTAKDYDNESALGYLFYLAIKTSRTDDPWTMTNGPSEESEEEWEAENDYSPGTDSSVMDFDNNAFPSIWICQAVDYFESIGVTLPTYLQDKLEEIGYEDFYYGAYYPIYHTVALAQRIGSGEIASPTEITEEELAFLNEVWVSGYAISNQIVWNWNSGDRFETYYAARTAYIAFLAGGTLTTDEGEAYKTYQYFAVVADYLESLGYEINGNGWGVTAETIELTPKESDAAKAVVAKIKALSDITDYDYKGWTTTDSDVSGYLYSEILAYRAASEAYNALSGSEKIYVALNIDMAQYNAWATVSNEFATLIEAAADAPFTTYNKVYGWTGTQDYDSVFALSELIQWAHRISVADTFTGEENDDPNTANENTGAAPGAYIMNVGNTFYPSLRIVAAYEYLTQYGTLPAYAQELLEKIGFTEFYEGVYLPIYNTTKLAQRIVDDEITTLSDLTEEEFAFLNQVWVNEYTISALISWNWNSGNRFEAYYQRTSAICVIAGGKLDKSETATCLTDTYFEVVRNFLSSCGYTVKDNGWGVTVDEIKAVVLDESQLEVLTEWNKLGNFNSASSYIGWESVATEEQAAQINGYLKNEIEHFTNVILVKYNALTSDKQADFRKYVGEANFDGWKTLSAELTELMATDAFKNFSVQGPNATNSSVIETYTAGDAIRQIIYYSIRIANVDHWSDGANDDNNTSSNFDYLASDGNWLPSFRILFFRQKLIEAGVTIPQAATNAFKAISEDDNAINLMADFNYLYNVLSLAAKIKSGAITTLNEEVANVVNTYMVNFTAFAEGGLNWNFNFQSTGDFCYRSKAYKLYFGLDMNTTLADYVKLITNIVVAEGYTLTDSGLGVTTTVTAK